MWTVGSSLESKTKESNTGRIRDGEKEYGEVITAPTSNLGGQPQRRRNPDQEIMMPTEKSFKSSIKKH